MYRPETAVYATFDAPATIDATLDAIEARGMALPFTDLLHTTPCGGLQTLQKGSYAGRHFLDGDWYHHLLLETDGVDVQMWVAIGDEPEIRKLIVTYRDAPGEPQYTAVLTDWNFAPAIDSATFAFVPPEGVRKVAYRGTAESQGGDKSMNMQTFGKTLLIVASTALLVIGPTLQPPTQRGKRLRRGRARRWRRRQQGFPIGWIARE